jgi:hypothetical protein
MEEGFQEVVGDEEYVVVRRQWNDWRTAKYRLSDVEDVRWDRFSGGVQAPAPQYFLHGYVRCDEAVEGEVAHSGMHGDCPHRIKACIVKKDNDKQVYQRLAEKAGPKPTK